MKLEEAIQQAKEKWENNPELKKDRDGVIRKYGEVFKLENIDKITPEIFLDFLRYSENKHWRALNQPGGHLIKDMGKLKTSLKIILDESQTLPSRIKRLRDQKSNDHIDYFGPAIYTPILLVTNPEKYPVVNGPVITALEEFGLYSKKQKNSKNEWEWVPEMQKIIMDISSANDLGLWQVDWVWKRDEDWLKSDVDLESRLLDVVKNLDMKANYQPIVLKTLLEKGADVDYTASLDEIKEKINLLNFGRKSFHMSDAIKAVSQALRGYVTFGEEQVSLNMDLFVSGPDLVESEKICGQKIVQWHIENIVKSEYEMWHIMPGSRDEDFKYLDEFIKTNSIGIGWDKVRNISNLSEIEIKQKFEEHYSEGWNSFENFTKIKTKDIVVLTKGQEEIIDFGIVVSDYEFKDVMDPSYPHRKNVIWLKRGSIPANELPKPTLSGMRATCGKLVERKQELVEVLLEKEKQYFLLQVSKPGSTNILENGKYNHPNWNYSKKNKAHGEIKVGDLLLVYFAGKAINHKSTLKMIYQVKSITEDKVGLTLELWGELEGISYRTLQNLIQTQELGEKFKKIGQEAFNIAKITKQDFEKVLSIDGGKLSLSNKIEDTSMVDEAGFMNFKPQLGSWVSGKYACLIKEFAALDGKPIDVDTKRQYLQMLDTCEIRDITRSTPAADLEETDLERDYASYQSLIPIYGFGRNDREKFELTDIARYFIKNNDIEFFMNHEMLKFQYPNGTFGIRGSRGEGFKIRPLVFFLKILCKLYENNDACHLSKIEINLIRKHTGHDNTNVENAYNEIMQSRQIGNASNDLNPDCEQTITRFFPAFGATGLITYSKGARKEEPLISLNDQQYVKTRATLDVLEDANSLEYKQHGNSDEWLTYWGNLIPEIIEALKMAEYKSILDNSKHQIIFYGPPGTGKTHVAKKLANLVTNAPLNNWSITDYRKLVQFHPSYSYEDFVQGIKPVKTPSGIDYEIRPGIFQKLCIIPLAEGNTSKVLIIDEINRGNLPKIFGELIYALEYRDEPIELQYKEFDEASEFGTLVVPENLSIIGSMNTADRSIVLFDTALRRRFSFIPLFPDYDLLAQIFHIDPVFDETNFRKKFVDSNNFQEMQKIISVLALVKINSKLIEDPSIGREKQIGHTFVMALEKNPQQFIKVWKYDIIPLLEEFYFESPEEITTLFGEEIFTKTDGIRKFTEEQLFNSLKKFLEIE